MTEDELKQFKELAKKYERGKDKEAVLKLFSEDIHEVFQEVNDRGHSAATKAKQADLDRVSGELTTAKSQLDEATRKLAGIQEAPDVATMRAKYEADEKKLREETEQRLANKDKEWEGKVKEKEEALTTTRLSVAKQELVRRLTADPLGVDPEYAETVLVARPDVTGRLKVEADGSVKVLKKGSTDMFIAAAEGRTPLDHLAEELGEGVDAKWKVAGTGRGSGTTGSSGGSGTNKAAEFEAARARVKTREEAGKKARESGSALDRLGARR